MPAIITIPVVGPSCINTLKMPITPAKFRQTSHRVQQIDLGLLNPAERLPFPFVVHREVAKTEDAALQFYEYIQCFNQRPVRLSSDAGGFQRNSKFVLEPSSKATKHRNDLHNVTIAASYTCANFRRRRRTSRIEGGNLENHNSNLNAPELALRRRRRLGSSPPSLNLDKSQEAPARVYPCLDDLVQPSDDQGGSEIPAAGRFAIAYRRWTDRGIAWCCLADFRMRCLMPDGVNSSLKFSLASRRCGQAGKGGGPRAATTSSKDSRTGKKDSTKARKARKADASPRQFITSGRSRRQL
ncbi:hypothetical protein DFH06DRAFT_1421005 [Mycena polygramma]|nr:hypothetical protein DFH06DRAFT_1421005 [Mycena polygramma]